MFDVLLVTHGHLGEEFLATARMVFGEPGEGVRALGFCPGESQDALLARIEDGVRESSARGGCMVLADIVGGSPFLMAARVWQELHGEVALDVVSGLGLGMLLEVLGCRDSADLAGGVEAATCAAAQAVQVRSEGVGS